MEEEKKSIIITTANKSMTQHIRENPWIISTIVLAVLSFLLIFTSSSLMNSQTISEKEAGEMLVGFYEAQGINGLEVVLIEDSGDLYKVDAQYKGETIPFYVTKSGYLTGNSIVSLSEKLESEPKIQSPKSDIPKVELFVMSYCPYGTQAEKGILPVVALLKNKIDFKLRFVHYTLHGEKEELENKRQICIREEQGQDILNKYLVCILNSTDVQNPGDVTACEKTTGVNSIKLKTCLTNKADEYYKADSTLSQGYGVQGSPTLIINDVESDSGRSPSNYLKGICNAFNNAPEECLTELSDSNPSAGFGYNEGTDTVAKC